MKIAETARLIIENFNTDDAPFVLRILNSPGWLQFIGDRGVKTAEDAGRYITDRFIASYEKFGFGMYIIRLKESLEPVGMSGLVKRDNLAHADLGYALLPEYAGKGYAMEAAAAVLEYANKSLELHTVFAIVTPNNNSSIALLQKLGFTFEKEITDKGERLHLFKK